MVETKKYIKELRKNFVRINDKQEKAILKYWEEFIDDYLFTDQDIWEQTRKTMLDVDKI